MDRSLFEAALAGYQARYGEVEEKIKELQAKLGDGHPHRKNRMSRAARKRIADAQKKRWAAYHEAQH